MNKNIRSKHLLAFALLTAAFFMGAIESFGQGIQSGSVLGAVKDSSGAMVANARVVLKNTKTGISVSTLTSIRGEYLFPHVAPAEYEIEFVAAGFKRVIQPLTVQVVMSTTVDANLEIGEVNQAVTVSGQTSLLETASGSLGTLIPNRMIADLPLRGGNPMMVFTLSPGLAQVNAPSLVGLGNNGPVSGSGQVAYNSSNGGDSNGNYYQLDGAANERTDQPAFQPPTEQVEEVNIMTNTYDAQYGRTQGALINVITKSGTNSFHGSAYEFFENDVLNANTFFGNLNRTKKPPFRYNQFGASLGGPIVRNRTFFFANYEGDRANQPKSQVQLAPTALERQGDFSQTVIGGKSLAIYNPFTTHSDPNNPGRFLRDPFPNSVIPRTLLSPVALNYMNFLQLPNISATQVFGNLASPATLNYYSGRLDHNFNDKLRVFSRTSISWLTAGDPISALQPFFYPEFNHRYSVSAGLTWSLTPATIVEFFGGWVRTVQLDPQAVPTDTRKLGFSAAFDAAMPEPNLAPGLNVTSYQTILGRGSRWDNEGPWSFNSNVTHIFGRHNLKAGFQTDIYQANSGGINPPVLNFTGSLTQGPSPTATGANIGSGLADLLLGTFASGSFSSPTNQARTRKYFGIYLQEDYRVTSRLSLNLGLRWDGWLRATDRFNGMNIGWAYNTPNPVQGPATTNYAQHPIPELAVSQFSSAITGGVLFATPQSRGAGASQLNNWSPRIGLVYRLTDKTVLRGGYGLFKSFLYWGSASSAGFSASTDAVGTIDGITPYNLLNNPFPQGVTQPSGASLGLLTSVGSSATFTDQNLTPQTIARWNFGIQRQVSANTVVEAQYVGSTFFNTTIGNVAAVSGTGDPNSLTLHNISNQIFTTLGPTGRLNQTVANPFFGVLPSNSTLGSTSQISVMNLLSSYPEYSSVTSSHPSGGRGYYHSLQLTATKRYSYGFTAMGTYTFAKDIERRYVLNNGDQSIQKMLYPFSVPHRFTLAALWELPFGAGHAMGWKKGIGGHLVGGWQMNVQWVWQSGILALLKTPIVQTGVNPALPADQRRYDNWFNKSAYAVLPAWTLRTAALTDPRLRGGPINEWDTSLFKNFALTERFRLQFRFEAFNVFNLHSFQSPDTNPNSGTYGSALTLTEQPRILQFGLKLRF